MTAILMLASLSYSQDSANIKTAKESARAELVSRCEALLDKAIASDAYIKQLESTLKTKDEEIVKHEKLADLTAEQMWNLKAEQELLRGSLAAERIALAETQAALAETKKALAKMTKKKNFWKGMTKVLVVTTAVAGAVAAGMVLKD